MTTIQLAAMVFAAFALGVSVSTLFWNRLHDETMRQWNKTLRDWKRSNEVWYELCLKLEKEVKHEAPATRQ